MNIVSRLFCFLVSVRLIAAGSDDMSTRIYPIQDMSNFRVTSLGGHNAAVLAVFFEKDSLDCYTLSRLVALTVTC